MGKAKRKLNAARKVVFKDLTKQYNPEDKYKNDVIPAGIIIVDRRDRRTKLFDTSWDMRQEMFDYVEEAGYPMCEYLDIDNMVNFVEWILKNN